MYWDIGRMILKYMRAFAAAWPERGIVQRVVAQLPWGHVIRLLRRVKQPEVREWYQAVLRYFPASDWNGTLE